MWGDTMVMLLPFLLVQTGCTLSDRESKTLDSLTVIKQQTETKINGEHRRKGSIDVMILCHSHPVKTFFFLSANIPPPFLPQRKLTASSSLLVLIISFSILRNSCSCISESEEEEAWEESYGKDESEKEERAEAEELSEDEDEDEDGDNELETILRGMELTVTFKTLSSQTELEDERSEEEEDGGEGLRRNATMEGMT